MTHQGSNHHRPASHNRIKAAPTGGGVRARRNGIHHHQQEKIDSQNNILKKSGEATLQSTNREWDCGIPIPELSLRSCTCLVAILSLFCYLNSCCGDFVFDDAEAVLSNKDIKPETPISELFQDDFWGERIVKNHSHKSYRPLTVLSFRLNYILSGGYHPFGFHLTNVILHSFISVFSLRIFSVIFSDAHSRLEAEKRQHQCQTFPAPRASLLCSLLFTVHPIHTESVAGIVGRADLLSTVFFFLSFYVYVAALQKDASHSLLKLSCSILCCAASMLCKEQGITALGVCIIYDIIVNCQVDILQVFQRFLIQTKSHAPGHPKWLPGLVTRLFVVSLCALVLLVGRFIIMGSGPPPFQPSDNPASFADGFLTRVTNYNFIYALNLWLLIFPHWLCFDWSMGCVSLIQSATDIRLLAPIALWVLLACLIYRCVVGQPSHNKRVLTMALAFLIIPFLPASNLFLRVGFVIAERVLYLPSLGFCMLLTLLINKISCSPVSKRAVRGLLVVLMACYIGRCIQRNQDWMTEEKLYKAGLDVCPQNAKVHYNIGKNAADRGNLEEAITYYRQALSLNPVYDQAMNNLANLLKDQGRLTEAEKLLQKAVQIKPQFAAAWMNLGIVQAVIKKYTDAEQSYKTALFHRPRYADCYFNLGNMYLDTGRHDNALKAWYKATSLQPGHVSAWANIATLHERAGRYETAILVAKEAMKHVPQEPSIYFGLGNVLGKEGRYQEAEENFLKAIRLNPMMANYHGNLGVLYHRWGKFSEARKHYLSALELVPESDNVRENLKKLEQTMAKKKTKKHTRN
ncbi:transmembrane and TPR repeat-containing protein 4-like isoform X2 [Acanthaster planci]|uniref:dolichyl-phosphate-mannose--protein mannosyltransferase n=1 Tax=Acanthaster planci TaxID=133434 RepID=A0A8B7Z106_ACAPL|nr:transmembrane and TPR repeat-containing protein 4-like isoform X2 [Acanthaster planci]